MLSFVQLPFHPHWYGTGSRIQAVLQLQRDVTLHDVPRSYYGCLQKELDFGVHYSAIAV